MVTSFFLMPEAASQCNPLMLSSSLVAGLVKNSDVEAVKVLDKVEAKVELEKLGDILSRTNHSII